MEILLGLALLVPLAFGGGFGLSGKAGDAASVVLPEAAGRAEPAAGENPWKTAYHRLLVQNADLRARLVALGEAAKLVAMDPAWFGRNPVRIEAAVLGRDASPWRGSLLISAGEADGVRPGFPVVVGHVLVGIVRVTGTRTSRVRLLTDPGQRTWAGILSGGETSEGYLAGTGDAILEMRLVKAGAGRPGDPVLTGGGSALVPRGLLVGGIEEIGDANRDGLAEVAVRPALVPEEVRFVNVLASEGQ